MGKSLIANECCGRCVGLEQFWHFSCQWSSLVYEKQIIVKTSGTICMLENYVSNALIYLKNYLH